MDDRVYRGFVAVNIPIRVERSYPPEGNHLTAAEKFGRVVDTMVQQGWTVVGTGLVEMASQMMYSSVPFKWPPERPLLTPNKPVVTREQVEKLRAQVKLPDKVWDEILRASEE